MSTPLYFTTSDAPPIPVSFVDSYGNIPPSFTTGTFTLKFRSLSTGQKVAGSGSFSSPNQATGIVMYNISSTDMANAYAAFSANPGIETFEVLSEVTISSLVYDAQPMQIQIRKI